MTRAKVIRAWLAENGHACPERGSVPARLVQLYEAAHPDEATPDQVPDDDPPEWTVTVTMPEGVEPDVIATISGHILEALWSAYYAGHAAGRAPLDEILSQYQAGR